MPLLRSTVRMHQLARRRPSSLAVFPFNCWFVLSAFWASESKQTMLKYRYWHLHLKYQTSRGWEDEGKLPGCDTDRTRLNTKYKSAYTRVIFLGEITNINLVQHICGTKPNQRNPTWWVGFLRHRVWAGGPNSATGLYKFPFLDPPIGG